MAASTHEEIKVGDMAIRFLLEGEQSAGSVAASSTSPPARSSQPHTATTATRRRSTDSTAY